MLIPSQPARAAAQPHTISLTQRHFSSGRTPEAISSKRGISALSSPYAGKPMQAYVMSAGNIEACASVARMPCMSMA